MGRLEGRVALVTGTGPNNGGTIAHFMAKEGARIVANDVFPQAAEETAEFLQSRGYDAIAVPGDASNHKEVQEIVQKTVEHFGRVDILVNLVGAQYRWGVLDINIYDWNRQLNGYLTGGMLTTKYVARVMVEKGIKGSIIHVASDAGHQGEPGNSGYSAAKAGLINFARAAAMDLAHYGIRVNTISPTAVEHNLWRFPPVPPQVRSRYRTSTEDFLRGVPLGRLCRTTDIANLAVFLASDEASFLTGVEIPLDGGARARYWPWVPGNYTGINRDDYMAANKPLRYGEPVEEEEE